MLKNWNYYIVILILTFFFVLYSCDKREFDKYEIEFHVVDCENNPLENILIHLCECEPEESTIDFEDIGWGRKTDSLGIVIFPVLEKWKYWYKSERYNSNFVYQQKTGKIYVDGKVKVKIIY